MQSRYLGKTIHRKIDQEETIKAGGRIRLYGYRNNSSNDFYVRESQSIKNK
ncbi:hypothetical protein MASR2M69_18470 [Bacteroidota bacterium]